MAENLSKAVGAWELDLTQPRLNQLVLQEGFQFADKECTNKYKKVHTMILEIEIARRVTHRTLGCRLGFFERRKGGTRDSENVQDKDVAAPLMAGLVASRELSEVKMMGGIIHPLFQGRKKMVLAGLCTSEQFRAGRSALLGRITRYYESKDAKPAALIVPQERHEFDEDEVSDLSPYIKNAQDELILYNTYKSFAYLPEMSHDYVLGAYDDDGNPQPPAIVMGCVKKRGTNLPSGKNHAEYMSKTGWYNITQYLIDQQG